jgi:hypothetical protein
MRIRSGNLFTFARMRQEAVSDHRKWATYLQTCPEMGALAPVTLLGGSGEAAVAAGVVGSWIGLASSSEW